MIKSGVVSVGERQEEYFAAMIIVVVIIFFGYISPKLPYNRHTGLRLPWTVQDEETWNVAHQILGIISIPLGIVYLIMLTFVEDLQKLSMIVILLEVGIPGMLSLLYYYKKYRGKR